LKYNAAVREARAQVELPFAIIDKKFEPLPKCWNENKEMNPVRKALHPLKKKSFENFA